MSLTYGFYNSQNGDRRYDAEQMSGIFDGIITDGIFESIGDKFMVTAGSGMTVNVGEGRAWFNHTWTLNDTKMSVTIPTSELTLKRIDTIVIDINRVSRINSIVVVKGAPASNPVAPTLTKDDGTGHYQYPLCDVLVAAGATAITQADITNRVGVDYPFVTAATKHITANELVAQWESEFNAWIASLKGLLSGDAAGNLANQCLTLNAEKISRNGSIPMIDTLKMGGHRITNLGDPTYDTDAANKRYTDNKATKCELIWSNASQTSAMAAQSIIFNHSIKCGEVYDALYIRCRYFTSNGYEQGILLMSPMGGICSFPRTYLWGIYSGDSEYSRCFLWNDHAVQISDGYAVGKNSADGAHAVANSFCYPIAIYGIKWTGAIPVIPA